MARLCGYVHVHRRAADGSVAETVAFGPDDDLPDWAADEITNPAAWEGGVLPEPAEAESKVPTRRQGAKVWAGYAKDNGVDVAEDAERDVIIAALEKAGVPVQ